MAGDSARAVHRSKQAAVARGDILLESAADGPRLVQIGEPPTGIDLEDWIRAQAVLAIHQYRIDHQCSVAEACRQTGWSYYQYRQGTQSPAVMGLVMGYLEQSMGAAAYLADARLLETVQAQVDVATDPKEYGGQASTRAATFLLGLLREYRSMLEARVRQSPDRFGVERLKRVTRQFGAVIATMTEEGPAPDSGTSDLEARPLERPGA